MNLSDLLNLMFIAQLRAGRNNIIRDFYKDDGVSTPTWVLFTNSLRVR